MKHWLFCLVSFGLPASAVWANDVQLSLDQADSGNYYIQAMLDADVSASLLLDTGSGYVSLSQKTFAQINRDSTAIPVRHITGKMADGRTISVPVYRLRELQLAENCRLLDIEVAVFPQADRDILGLNALRQLQPFTISLSPPQLSANCHS